MNEKISYSLATIDSPDINSIRELSVEEFENISTEINNLERFHSETALYNIIELNLKDLIVKRDFYLSQYITDPKLDFSELSDQFLDLNRLILNLLSSIRTYLDHTETRLKRTFGDKSTEFELFKKLTSNCFDDHFAYRFLSKLRNYSQHCGMPTGSINIEEGVEGHSLKLSLVRDNLLEGFDSWGAKVKPDLQKQDEEFDVFPLLNKKTELLREVNNEISSTLLQKLKTQGDHLLSLIRETQDKGKGIPCILKISGDINHPTFQFKWFPYEVISKITEVAINVTYCSE